MKNVFALMLIAALAVFASDCKANPDGRDTERGFNARNWNVSQDETVHAWKEADGSIQIVWWWGGPSQVTWRGIKDNAESSLPTNPYDFSLGGINKQWWDPKKMPVGELRGSAVGFKLPPGKYGAPILNMVVFGKKDAKNRIIGWAYAVPGTPGFYDDRHRGGTNSGVKIDLDAPQPVPLAGP